MSAKLGPQYQIIISAEQTGLRLDRVLADLEFISSRTRGAELIEMGLVTLNNRPLRASYRVQAGNSIEIYGDWFPGEWSVDELIDTADIVDGIRFVNLASVIEWKKRMGREKDLNDLILIEEYQKKYPE